MGECLRRIIYYIYGLPFTAIVVITAISLTAYTSINIFAPKKLCRVINLITLICITIAILFFTITNRTTSSDRATRLIPFASFKNAGFGAYQSMWLNAFFFLPMGLSLPYLLPEKMKRKVLSTILIATVFSMCIEVVQFIFKLGLCETDDVIMNTLGATIGTLSYVFAHTPKTKN